MTTAQLKPPIILIGNVRSGTTMMHDLFNAHPDVVGWDEPRTLWVCADPGRRHDRFDERDATPRVIRYIRRRFLRYQTSHGGLRVMEKTPSNVMRIPYVHAIFPESKFLYVVREPLANLNSTDIRWNNVPIRRRRAMRRITETPPMQLPHYGWIFLSELYKMKILKRSRKSVWGVRYPGIYDDLKRMTVEEVIAKQWVACVKQAEADFAKLTPGIVLRVRYEDFVSCPVEHFERICAHFGLRMTPEFAEHVGATVDPNRQSKWRRLDEDLLRRCVPIYREEMERLGYALPDDVRRVVDGVARTNHSSC